MKRRISRRALVGGGLALLVALVVGIALVPDLRPGGSGASPTVLNRIERKNQRAATEAAAQMRAESRASAQAAESMRAAQERGRAEADAMIARFDNAEPGANKAAPATAR